MSMKTSCLAVTALAAIALAAAPAAAQKAKPITHGQKIVMATHSFNVFISTDPDRPAPTRTQPVTPGGAAAPDRVVLPNSGAGAPRDGVSAAAQAAARPARVDTCAAAWAPPPPATGTPLLTKLTNEAGFTGQEFLAVQMIGASTPMQHWNQCGGDESKNIAKAALAKYGAQVDVFTMSPNAKMPEEGIDHFGDYVIAHNPNARILVQNSWNAYDGHGTTPSVGGTGGGSFKNAERDAATEAEVDGWLKGQQAKGGYLEKMRAQLAGINKRAGKPIAYVVPSADAVYQLRKQVIEGHVPGLAKQSDMHRDPIGHPTTPTSHLVAYVWFAAMYQKSPVGLQALVNKSDPTSAAREKILQQVAWNAVVSEPMSGVKGKAVKLTIPKEMLAAK